MPALGASVQTNDKLEIATEAKNQRKTQETQASLGQLRVEKNHCPSYIDMGNSKLTEHVIYGITLFKFKITRWNEDKMIEN